MIVDVPGAGRPSGLDPGLLPFYLRRPALGLLLRRKTRTGPGPSPNGVTVHCARLGPEHQYRIRHASDALDLDAESRKMQQLVCQPVDQLAG